MSGGVLNTRPREQARELTRLLTAAGFEVFEAPAIQTVPAWDPAALQTVRKALAEGEYAWVVLPSRNAGRLLVDDLAAGRMRVVCGASSARALSLKPEFALERFSASAAVELMRPMLRPGQAILIPRAADASGELVAALQALGANVHAPVAYRTVGVEPSTLTEAATRLANGSVKAVTVCSPSAITALLAAIPRTSLVASRLICLGATTAAAAREAGLRVDNVAETTMMAALVDAVRATLMRPAVPV